MIPRTENRWKGIGLLTCVYVNPKTHQYWIIDYRIYDIDRDGKTKLQHLQEMLRNVYFVKHLPFRTVLMDSWYASMKVMKAIESLSKIYYAPLKSNRLVNETDGVHPHKRIEVPNMDKNGTSRWQTRAYQKVS